MMPTIKTTVSQDDYAKLVQARRAAGLPSISAYLLKKAGILTDDMEADEIVRQALRRAKAKSKGEKFRLRDLFAKDLWDDFSKGARLRAGRSFYVKIGAAVHGIAAAGKSASHHQLYERR
jgi:hypothetical protein